MNDTANRSNLKDRRAEAEDVQTSLPRSPLNVGVYVDLANVAGGGIRMRFDTLRLYAEMCGTVLRLNTYFSFDADRAQRDREYENRARNFQQLQRALGYKTNVKEIQWYLDQETGSRIGKANADLDMAVDMLSQSDNLDLVLLVTGDGDFIKVVEHIQNRGRRVELIGFNNVSRALREKVDSFISGWLIPDLVDTPDRQGADRRFIPWGELGSTVRGTCYRHSPDENYGYLSYLKTISPYMWLSNTRNPLSPYDSAFFHDSNLPDDIRPGQLPSRNHIFEFEIGQNEKGKYAENLRLISSL